MFSLRREAAHPRLHEVGDQFPLPHCRFTRRRQPTEETRVHCPASVASRTVDSPDADSQPRGFMKSGTRFRWPVWKAPLSLSAIRTVLGFPTLFAPEPSPITLGSYGICALFETERVTIGKGYGQFRPGIRVC
jgi:hypothetical protein